ncbi:MAG: preprotein translocase subunit SecE [Spirochaetia bacterium]|nr:preprotein translocase subunit SecE [Spirochaetia bacterium]
MNKIVKFLKEAQIELKKVSWPTWEEVNRSTIIVFLTVILFTLFIFLADKAINFIVQKALG